MAKKKKEKEETVKLPNGEVVTKRSIKKGLIAGVAKTFRDARKKFSSSEDWIKKASKKVVDHLMEIDAYFDQMLELQKGVDKGLKKKLFGNKKRKEEK